MLTEYIEEALRRAHHALIDDPETPYFGEISDLPGVWASADTLEGCRIGPDLLGEMCKLTFSSTRQGRSHENQYRD